ncbi:MAG: fibro-slime domain-containing protein [Phycisphaerales bacterium JB043]
MTLGTANAIGRISALAILAGGAIALSPSAEAQDTRTIRTTVRDFKASHWDFDIKRSASQIAGNASLFVDEDGRPAFRNMGRIVSSGAFDEGGASIAAHRVDAPIPHGIDTFTITDAMITPDVAYAAHVTVLGAAIQASGYDMPVTACLDIDGMTVEPFGAFDMAVAGNLNIGGGPMDFPVAVMMPAGTPLSIDGRSWIKKGSEYSGNSENHWEQYMNVNSSSGSNQVIVLRDGDPVPAKDGFKDQLSAQVFVQDYIDFDTQTMKLETNQAIYLFELGTTSTTSSAADFQDLVVLVSLADDPSYFHQVIDNEATPYTPASLGAKDDASITDSRTMRQWFRNVPGANGSVSHRLEMTESGGVYEYSTTEFFPVDGEVYGNQGATHNHFFTLEFHSTTTYNAGTGQFIEFSGDGDVMVYINDELSIELSGSDATQGVDLDTLDLVDGQDVDVQFFFANRSDTDSDFSLRTNMDLTRTTAYRDPSSSLYD